jgi:hypothetical protein
MANGPKICFITGTQRTGTNLLRDILGSNDGFALAGEVVTPTDHPFCWYEFLKRKRIGAIGPQNWDKMNPLVDEWIAGLQDTMVGTWENGSTKSADSWVGGDIKYNQLRTISPVYWELAEIPYILFYIRERRGKVIHVRRRNILKLMLSNMIAEQSGVWHLSNSQQFEKKFDIDIDICLRRMKTAQVEEQEFLKHSQTVQVVECVYEDLVANMPTAERHSVATGLGGPLARISNRFELDGGFAPPANFKKVVNQPYGEIVSNFEALISAVSKSEFRDMADEVWAEEPQNAGKRRQSGPRPNGPAKISKWLKLPAAFQKQLK